MGRCPHRSVAPLSTSCAAAAASDGRTGRGEDHPTVPDTVRRAAAARRADRERVRHRPRRELRGSRALEDGLVVRRARSWLDSSRSWLDSARSWLESARSWLESARDWLGSNRG
jgi:hypothetical protein